MHNHLFSYAVSSGLYDLEYLEALFGDDTEAISEYELAAMDDGYGPLASCKTVSNFSSIRLNCREYLLFLSFVKIPPNINCQHVNIAMRAANFFLQR